MVTLATTERGGQEDRGPAPGSGGQAAAKGEGLQEAGGGRGESPTRPPKSFHPSRALLLHHSHGEETTRLSLITDGTFRCHLAEVQHSNKVIKL